MQLKEIMKEERERLLEIKKRAEDYIKNAPEGTFFASKNGHYFKWYTHNKGKKILIRQQDKELAYKLAKKAFAYFRLKETVKELKAIDAYMEHSSDADAESFLQEHEAIRQLITAQTPLPDRVREWANAPYQKNSTPYNGIQYKTLKGDLVKSKAEQEIADALFLAGLPYRYECAISFDNGKTFYYPDFMIMDPLTGKIYIWEHFGLSELNYYQHKNADKLYVYFDHGFVPGLNLITTASDDKNKLTAATIQQVIRLYFPNQAGII